MTEVNYEGNVAIMKAKDGSAWQAWCVGCGDRWTVPLDKDPRAEVRGHACQLKVVL